MKTFFKKIENLLFKKIELWVLLIVIIFFIVFSYTFGVLVRQGIEGRTELGKFSITKITKPIVEATRLPEKIIKRILKPNELRIKDFWDKEIKFSEEVKGFNGKGVKNKYLLLSPSVMATIKGISAAAASIIASAANAGGTRIIEAFASVASTASSTELKIGTPSKSCPPFPGVTPATTFVP